MSTISSVSISRNDLLTRAKDFSTKVENDGGFPYKEAVRDESDFFTGMLENAKGGTLGEIRDNSIATSAAASKKASIASMAGTGLLVASFLVPLPASASLLRLGGIAGGFILSNIVGGRAAHEAAEQKKFAGQLTEWETALAAQAPAPTAQPAAAQA